MSRTPENALGDSDSGNPSLDGWFYQCDVSVLAALDLLVVNRVAKVLQLEPASQEDLEAELEAPRVSSSAIVDGERLVVQAKLRRSGQWTDATLRNLVAHGTKRPSALNQLSDARVRYILITSADVSGALGCLQVDDFLEAPSGDDLPSAVFPPSHVKSAAGRFAVMAQFNEARVVERIDAHLFSPLCIPKERHDACREELRKVAIAGMRSGLAWNRVDVEVIVKKHGGSIPGERDARFVKPMNWDDIVAHMDKRNAIVITGPSGTGKTTVAKALYEHYKRIVPGLNYVEPEGPGDLKARIDGGPAFFYVEDPWGKYEIKGGTADWTAELDERLLKANVHQKIVVTSRTDILAATAGSSSELLKPWEVQLDASKYGERELGNMFEARVRALNSSLLKMAAIRSKEQVLRTLQTPFEIDRFVALLQSGAIPADENEFQFVSRVLSETQTRAIEKEVQLTVEGRHYEAAAVVLWGLMAARRSISRKDIPLIRRAISKLDSGFGSGLERLINDLVASGNLRQAGSDVTYTHPRVEQGLMRVVRADPAVTEVALVNLTTAFVRMESDGGRAIETVVRLHAAIKNINEPLYEVPEEVQRVIDTWLEAALSADHDDYVGLLRLAAIAGSRACVPAEVARWFRPVPTGAHFFMSAWKRSLRDDAWYEMVRTHPLTPDICRRFIRLVLAVGTRDYPHQMATLMDDISSGLDAAWADAARVIVHHGEDPNAVTIAFGSMRSPVNREVLLQLALAELRKEAASTHDSADDWSCADGHYNEDWEGHDGYQDDYYAARELVSAYAAATRAAKGWQALASHPDVQELKGAWFDAMRAAAHEDVSDEELRHLLNLGAGENSEQHIWRSLGRAWRPSFERELRERLLLGAEAENLRELAVRCALVQAPDLLVWVASSLFQEGRFVRLLELAYDAKVQSKRFDETSTLDQALEAFELRLQEPFVELSAALMPLHQLEEVKLSDAALDALVPLLGLHRGPLRVLLVWLAAVNGRATEDVLNDALGESIVPEEAEAAVQAAAAAGRWSLVRAALNHPRAKARRRALELLTTRGGQVIPEGVAELVNDPSALVRRAVVGVLSRHPDRNARELVQLCEDTWSHHSVPKGEDQNYPIAQAAAKALSTLSTVPSELTGPIVEAALETDDLSVTALLFALLTDHGDDDALNEVVNQVFTFRPNWASVEAAAALTRTRRTLASGALARADERWFMKSNRYLAATAAEAVGNCADQSQIIATAATLATREDRRVLLIPLAIGAERQSSELAEQVLSKLPPGHLAANILDASKHPLPHDTLDDLGDVRTVNAIHELVGGRLAGRPSLLGQARK